MVQPREKMAASKDRMRVAQARIGRRPMRVETMLRKEKDGELYKETKLSHVMLSCLDEFLKISSGENGPAGKLINEIDEMDEERASTAPEDARVKQQFPGRPTLPLHDPPAPPEDTPPPSVTDNGLTKLQHVMLLQLDEEFLKQAGLGSWAAKKGKGAWGLITGSPIKSGVIDPSTGKEMLIAAKKPFQELGESLMESGKLMQAKPTIAGVHGLPKAPGTGQRILGSGIEGMGKSYNAEALINPIGLPAGGFAGGVMRGGARELAEAGHPTAANVVGKLEGPARFLAETGGVTVIPAVGGVNPLYAAGKGALGTGATVLARRFFG